MTWPFFSLDTLFLFCALLSELNQNSGFIVLKRKKWTSENVCRKFGALTFNRKIALKKGKN